MRFPARGSTRYGFLSEWMLVLATCCFVGWGAFQSLRETALGIAVTPSESFEPVAALTIRYGWPCIYLERDSAEGWSMPPLLGPGVRTGPLVFNIGTGIVLVLASGCFAWKLARSHGRWTMKRWGWFVVVVAVNLAWWRWEQANYLRSLPLESASEWRAFAPAFERYSNSPMLRMLNLPIGARLGMLFACSALVHQLPGFFRATRDVLRRWRSPVRR
jgi:hypothetical protein